MIRSRECSGYYGKETYSGQKVGRSAGVSAGRPRCAEAGLGGDRHALLSAL